MSSDYSDSKSHSGNLSRKFPILPFSVFDTRQHTKRIAMWKTIGIKSELGRDAKAYDTKNSLPGKQTQNDTSIFNPVVTEMMYNWFCPKNGIILDPFAGGSVRGVVAGVLDYEYYGIDLRKEQIQANIDQINTIKHLKRNPKWICGDSAIELDNAPKSDFMFSCPPYFDLEVYSDNPNDLSTMTYGTFLTMYEIIIRKCYDRLVDDSFACFVVGELRDSNGDYRNFVGDTITAFLNSGFKYFSEMILVNNLGTLPIRVDQRGTAFSKYRKIGKHHQNILVFCKGDNKKAAEKNQHNDLFTFDKLMGKQSVNLFDM